ncbi:beta-phosphoglucomutase-like phosphatase (HAD superfamily) [Sinorhizobium fredii]
MDTLTTALFPKKFAALLFDMDGTLLNSMAVVERVWGAWAVRNGLDPHELMISVHGVRASDTIRKLGLAVDPDIEARELALAEIADVEGIVEIPGAVAFLNSLPPRALDDRHVGAARTGSAPPCRGRHSGSAPHGHRRGCHGGQA